MCAVLASEHHQRLVGKRSHQFRQPGWEHWLPYGWHMYGASNQASSTVVPSDIHQRALLVGKQLVDLPRLHILHALADGHTVWQCRPCGLRGLRWLSWSRSGRCSRGTFSLGLLASWTPGLLLQHLLVLLVSLELPRLLLLQLLQLLPQLLLLLRQLLGVAAADARLSLFLLVLRRSLSLLRL